MPEGYQFRPGWSNLSCAQTLGNASISKSFSRERPKPHHGRRQNECVASLVTDAVPIHSHHACRSRHQSRQSGSTLVARIISISRCRVLICHFAEAKPAIRASNSSGLPRTRSLNNARLESGERSLYRSTCNRMAKTLVFEH